MHDTNESRHIKTRSNLSPAPPPFIHLVFCVWTKGKIIERNNTWVHNTPHTRASISLLMNKLEYPMSMRKLCTGNPQQTFVSRLDEWVAYGTSTCSSPHSTCNNLCLVNIHVHISSSRVTVAWCTYKSRWSREFLRLYRYFCRGNETTKLFHFLFCVDTFDEQHAARAAVQRLELVSPTEQHENDVQFCCKEMFN